MEKSVTMTNNTDTNMSLDGNHFHKYLLENMDLKQCDPRQYSPLTLAYIGDGIYDIVIRTMVLSHGNAPVNKLHKISSSFVKAQAQMNMYHAIEEILTEEELGVYKRGRNAKSYTSAKNATITEYRCATGFEALLGYLYLMDRFDRILELIKHGFQKLDLKM